MSVIASVETNRYAAYPALQQEWIVSEEKKLVNFDPWIYRLNSDRLELLPEDVEKYFAECLMLSTVGTVTIDPEKGFLHASGATYNEVFRRSIEHYQSNPQAVERFQAEWEGFLRTQLLVESYAQQYGLLPPFLLASPPGEVYDIGVDHTKSLTYVGIPLGHDAAERPQYALYSVPTPELPVEEHWGIVEAVADVQTSLQLLAASMQEITPNTVVAMPALFTSLESSLSNLAVSLGFSSWEAIENDTQASVMLDGEYDRTKDRRKGMIEWSVGVIRQLVNDAQPKEEFEALQETLRQVFAAERGSKYVEQDLATVLLEMEQLFVGNGGNARYTSLLVARELLRTSDIRFSRRDHDLHGEDHVYTLALSARNAMLSWIGSNPLAHDSYIGTGCGSAGPNTLMGADSRSSFYERPTYSGFDMMQNFGWQANQFEDVTSSSSTGKYTEFYDYRRGVCKHCGHEKPYVAYPKSSEEPCAGWCSDCET